MSIMDSNIVSVALPSITSYFSVSVSQSQWVMSVYFLTITAMFLVFGKLSEYTGKTKLFISGFFLFTVSSFACGLSMNIDQLILFRMMQAFGASMVFSISTAIILDVFPQGERGRALGYQAATVGIGMIIAPALGGLIVDTLGWEYIFFINIPIGIILLASSLKYLKLEEHKSRHLSLDWIGASMFVVLMASLLLFIGQLSNVNNVMLAIYGSIFSVSSSIFILRELKCKDPLLDLYILKVKKFIKPTVGLVLFFISVNMINIIFPFYFQGVLNWKATNVGLALMIVAVMILLVSPVSGWAYDKYKFQNLSSLGLLIMGLTLLFFAYMLSIGNVIVAIISLAVIGTGCAIFMGPNNTDIMSSLPGKTNVLSSVTATFRNFGAVLGVSIASMFISSNSSSYTGALLQTGSSLGSVTINAFFGIGGICIVGAMIVFQR
jgi:EmrB/QacA subfamily drug resistance transporter